jgi:hypothetical protein
VPGAAFPAACGTLPVRVRWWALPLLSAPMLPLASKVYALTRLVRRLNDQAPRSINTQ